ncbi:hypothetical protein [Bradyrhizobium sp. SZCCHNR3015]|uniref:hypothetical protein n=1 Tax=Bradyrhizobium sp. SZCCHNR3015 TaxID=3057395 RepID=UPI002916394E|nr:hypothetical protein [Bradyrhizobium sp. SZCCHNR3015]
MTDLLKILLHQYGLLYITIVQLAKEAPGTSHESLKDYYASLGPALPSEPTLVVTVSADGETRFTRNFTGDCVPHDMKQGDVTLMELPEEEFYFFHAFRQGLFDLDKGVPSFILEMSFVHAYSIFETYVSDIVRLRLKTHPAQLGMGKQVTVADILASSDKDGLLDLVIDRELYLIMHEPLGAILMRLRERLGLRHLPRDLDDALVKLSLTRNCLIHNGGYVDARLAKADSSKSVGAKLSISIEFVYQAIDAFRRAAAAVDAALPQLSS